jgi:hypothetical protein
LLPWRQPLGPLTQLPCNRLQPLPTNPARKLILIGSRCPMIQLGGESNKRVMVETSALAKTSKTSSAAAAKSCRFIDI